MINRTMVRTRVIQTLFAYYNDEDRTPSKARAALRKSFADTYDLYFMLLAFANELTAYAQQQLEEQLLLNTHRKEKLDLAKDISIIFL